METGSVDDEAHQNPTRSVPTRRREWIGTCGREIRESAMALKERRLGLKVKCTLKVDLVLHLCARGNDHGAWTTTGCRGEMIIGR